MYSMDVYVEKNVHGAWVVWGDIGHRQYYGYTKSQAIKKYREEIKKEEEIERSKCHYWCWWG